MIGLQLLAIFVALFILYAVSRHDFVLIRQSISLRTVFDNAFIAFIVYFFVGRISYIVFSENFGLFNPLRFLYLTNFYGVISYFGILGFILTIVFLFRKKKNKLRILDIYMIAITPLIILDIILRGNGAILIAIKVISLLILIAFYSYFLKVHNKFTTKDGFITSMVMITYTLSILALSLAQNGIFNGKFLIYDGVLLFVALISGVFLFLVQRDTFNKQ